MVVYTFQEACDYLRIKRDCMFSLLKSGKVHGFKISNKWRFTDEELDKFIRSQMAAQNDINNRNATQETRI